jgi:thymidylate synthase
MNNIDRQYKELSYHILNFGVDKADRTGTGTKSIFGWQIRHNMKDGFPLLTTKKMAWKSIVTELLWFLRGDTNIKYLVDNGSHIWDGDAYKAYLKKCETLNVIKVDTPTFELNGKNIVVQTYNNGFPELKENEILYKYSESRGYIGTRYTQEEFINKIKTDDEFAKEWGELGPIYGKQWRSWNGKPEQITNYKGGEINPYFCDCQEGFEDGHSKVRKKNKGIDQIANLISELKTNPDSRRLIVSAWNVGELDEMVLPPCHYGFQMYTRELSLTERRNLVTPEMHGQIYTGGDSSTLSHPEIDQWGVPKRAISLMWNQRSVDTFLGLPFNIASYGLLLEIIAKEVNMVPEDLIGNLGDVHLYNNHIEQAEEQLSRTPYELPKLNINTEWWDKPFIELVMSNSFCKCLLEEDIQLYDYKSHPAIKAPLSN